ncbi:hypothetical protein GQ600_25208 [Phytophthora cactorum]|nr:hypothetical protein GQ600_25208 [Phytophthora cactorum]
MSCACGSELELCNLDIRRDPRHHIVQVEHGAR